jgi:hypothetical protein
MHFLFNTSIFFVTLSIPRSNLPQNITTKEIFYEFEDLTLIPYQKKMISTHLLSQAVSVHMNYSKFLYIALFIVISRKLSKSTRIMTKFISLLRKNSTNFHSFLMLQKH